MRTERRTRDRSVAPVGAAGAVGAALAALLLAGCAAVVPGTAWPEGRGPVPPPTAAGASAAAPAPSTGAGTGPPATTVRPEPVAPGPVAADPSAARPAPSPTDRAPGAAPPPTGAATPGGHPDSRPPLTSDVVPDECLLDGPTLTLLLGAEPAAPAVQADVRRADGSRARSCFAVGGSSSVSVNVYRTNLQSPRDYVRAAAGARPLDRTGAGTTAVLVETVAGPILQLGTTDHLVTVAVDGRTPTDAQWRTAAARAAAALAR